MSALIEKWNNEKANNSQKVNAVLDSISHQGTKDVFPTLNTAHTEVFQKINCLDCANCCKNAPPIITSEDINTISRALKITKKTFVKTYLLEDINGEFFFKRVPCVFLNPDNTCKIYAFRPSACRRYPHTDEPEFHKRLALNKQIVAHCPAAFFIIESIANQIIHDI